MSDPEFIHSTTPHEVVMPPGAHNAMGKTAHVGEPAIHRVLAQLDAPAASQPLPAEELNATDTAPPELKIAAIAAHDTANPAAPAEDEHDAVLVQQAAEHARTTASAEDLKSQISEELALRLAALQAENDHVLQQLDTLKTLMGDPS